MYLAALVITLIGWAFQAYETLVKKTRNINIILPITYVAACLLFGINSFMQGDVLSFVLDLVIALIALIIFIVLLKKK